MPLNSPIEIVLHAGTYKTATSTLQTLMTRNRDAVLARYGMLYPKTGTRRNTGSSNPDSMAHHLLFHAVSQRNGKAPPDKARKLADKLREEIDMAGVRRAVLCTELISGSSVREKHAFIEMMEGMTLSVIYAVRRPDDYAEASINQSFKNFRTVKVVRGKELPMLRDVQEWESLLGADRVTVHPFVKSDYEGYLRRTFASLGLKPEDPLIDTDLHDNPSMTLVGHLMRRAILKRLPGRAQDTLDRHTRHRLNVVLDALEKELPKSPRALFLTEAQRQEALTVSAPAMEGLLARMTPAEAETFRAELAAPVKASRNITRDIPIDEETLARISEGFSTGFIAKVLSGQGAEASGD